MYRAKGGKLNEPEGKKRDFFFREDTVKAAKELVSLKQQQNQLVGKVTLENVRESIHDVKKDQVQVKNKLNQIEETLRGVLEIMASRRPVVERI